MSIAVVFPGQGSQEPRAGAAWADHPAWSLVPRATAATGGDLAHLLLDAAADELRSTRAAQLSVLAASLVAWEALRPSLEGQPVVGFAGHSLGQVTALIAAGAVDEAAGLRFAAARADATQAANDATPGRMVAFLGATEDQAREACAAAPDEAWIANLNAPGQVVVAGTPDGVDAAATRAPDVGVRRVRPLEVGGAFHTPLMAPAAAALQPVLATTTFAPTAVPVVTNHDARPHADGLGWPEMLATHLTAPVRWADSVLALADLGATTFLEVGPGTTLAGLIRRIVPDAEIRSIGSPADLPAAALR
ncbi:MAG TPA: ACP S-malonyltransferase [Acidimicrobiales bacterium]